MAAPINNIAATFSAITTTTSSSPPAPFPCSSLTSASWNPHSSLSCSYKSSLLDLYGPPPPLPLRPISSSHNQIRRLSSLRSVSSDRVPNNVALTYLDGNGAVRSVSLGGLCKGKRRAVVVGVSAAFSPICTRFVKRAVDSAEKSRGADLIACVAANDAFVMRAWGESMAVDFDKWKMLSDGRGELWKELRVLSDGKGFQRFWLSASNGIVTHVSFDGDGDGSGDDH